MKTGTVLEVIEYKTKAGDTFDTLALEAYNEERMSSVLMDYNRDYLDTLIFEEDILLKVPLFDQRIDADSLPPWRREDA
jgi:hypothetical protein